MSSDNKENLASDKPTTSHGAKYDFFEYKRSRSNSPNTEPDMLDLSYFDLEECESNLNYAWYGHIEAAHRITKILLNNNLIKLVPAIIGQFVNVQTLDLSSNCLKILDENICKLQGLKNLIVRDNQLEDNSLPKNLGARLPNLEIVNLSGNLFTQFPYQLLEIRSLKEIYLGSNKISGMPRSYEQLQGLEILYLGGNQLKSLPEEICQLKNLTNLNLSNNLLSALPNSLAKLRNIKTLALHGNNLTHLPIELVRLNLSELSLRNNPLVSRFAKEFTYNVPTLLELSGRIVKTKSIDYKNGILPTHLVNYLNSAQCCLNPRCKGVYFTSKVEHIKFVDFCGKFRVPLMQYLCSSQCNEKISNRFKITYSSSGSDLSDSDDQYQNRLLKKILIG
ncbi:leucine-rich repeat-containing 58-like [Brachionus plicatilis]|uniref:Leucine-rich repeat-containing 58-like n=1 Tax=Brachionus plicatilis TaxID=10195 RepID=A0A3M7SXV4_BRAPC|nr:leucine-rich repeat-containing 58-like [Brachionus plicatilis]